MALKMEKQIKAKNTTMDRFEASKGFGKATSSKTPITPKTALKVQSKREGKQP